MLLEVSVNCLADPGRIKGHVASEMVCVALSLAFFHAQRNLGRSQPDDLCLLEILTIQHQFSVSFAVRFKMGIDSGEIRGNGSVPVTRLDSKEESGLRGVKALNLISFPTACKTDNLDQQS